MSRLSLLFAVLALMIAACGDEDAEREAEARAEIEAVRADYEAREANIEAAIKQAQEWRAKEGVPELKWGDRPAPKFHDKRKKQFDREATAHAFELTEEGEFNTAPMTLLGLFAEDDWREDMAEKMTGEGHIAKAAVRSTFEQFMQRRFLCLIITDEYKEAELGSATLSSVKFTPGQHKGRAFYFDLQEGTLIGGKAIEEVNSSNIDFKSSFEAEDQTKAAKSAAKTDLRNKVLDAVYQP